MASRLSASGCLAAWETGAGRSPLDRALAMLWAAEDDQPFAGDPADLPLAERDRRLLALWCGSFGPSMAGRASCPDCGAELELDLEASALAALLPDEPGQGLRPISSRDLAAVAELSPERVAAGLRDRIAGPGLTGTAAAEAERAIAEAAERAELCIRLTCAACAREWTEILDLPHFLWARVETSALALIGQVATLAAAYGWAERDILALSPARRLAYLQRAVGP
ncbi:hypothetical protein [Paracoccus zhejiangensis]|uniref:Phage baseplate protein n=1 Tax=Paracoccus zhejiangensis TaxID=1077935 RepID=A0A2H5EY59_9RHOB|nr:hypothetical protein [Paracoccus zhejiangensis]AUH64203.1 hypothetical protein CX676_08580 [Paracoccus zhejiangensis]